MICSIYVCFDHLSTFLCWLDHLRKKCCHIVNCFLHFLMKSIFQTGISQQQSIQITYHLVFTYIIYIVFLLWKIIAVTLTTKKLCWSENVTFRLKCLARAKQKNHVWLCFMWFMNKTKKSQHYHSLLAEDSHTRVYTPFQQVISKCITSYIIIWMWCAILKLKNLKCIKY